MAIHADIGDRKEEPTRKSETLLNKPMSSRVVVTGFGAVSCWGWDAGALWRGLSSGKTAIKVSERLDTSAHRTRLAGEVPPYPENLEPRQRSSRADLFASVASGEAWRAAGLQGRQGESAGLFFGGSTAAMAEAESFYGHFDSGELGQARISRLLTHPLNGPGDTVANQLKICGPVQTLSSACASGGLAIGAALDAIREGEIEIAVAGGSDSLCHLTFGGFNSLRIVDSEHCSPFRSRRQGLNLGEGAGVLVLETLESAQRRGVQPLAEILGVGASCDAYHMTAPHPEGVGAGAALLSAFKDAGVEAGEIDFINAHGTGTTQNDAAEWRAIERVFADRSGEVPLTSVKGSIGHLLGSSGAIEAVATVQCLLAGQIPPSSGSGPVDEMLGVDLVRNEPRSTKPGSIAVSTSFGFGGANVVLIFRGWQDEAELEG